MCAKCLKHSLTQYLSGTFSLASSHHHHREEKFTVSKTQILQGQIWTQILQEQILRPKYCRGKFKTQKLQGQI